MFLILIQKELPEVQGAGFCESLFVTGRSGKTLMNIGGGLMNAAIQRPFGSGVKKNEPIQMSRGLAMFMDQMAHGFARARRSEIRYSYTQPILALSQQGYLFLRS